MPAKNSTLRGFHPEVTGTHTLRNIPPRTMASKWFARAIAENINWAEHIAKKAGYRYGIADDHAVTALAHNALMETIASHPDLLEKNKLNNRMNLYHSVIANNMADYCRNNKSFVVSASRGKPAGIFVSMDEAKSGDGRATSNNETYKAEDKATLHNVIAAKPAVKMQIERAHSRLINEINAEIFRRYGKKHAPLYSAAFLLYTDPIFVDATGRSGIAKKLSKSKEFRESHKISLKNRIMEILDGDTLREIEVGIMLGITEGRVSQILSKTTRLVKFNPVLMEYAHELRELAAQKN
ncbi:Uncharacterised protein [uncultured archaeon]|nr:Uncharacterised protein [uncultured archaeon]